jgi:ubiquinone/menaquinone biosynthesis C-methylase UbiE
MGWMAKARISQADQWRASKEAAIANDLHMQNQRDNGRLQTESILRSRIDLGHALEIGTGPGHEGLEWLMKTEDTTLAGMDISRDMVALAKKNALLCGLEDRAEYRVGDPHHIPYARESFDAVFSIGSWHEWSLPNAVFDEINRVLRPGGKYFICDLRRDMNPLTKCFNYLCRLGLQKEMRRAYLSSVDASYTLHEARLQLAGANLEGWNAEQTSQNIIIHGRKNYRAMDDLPILITPLMASI